jgi:hypothetical protein
VRFPATSTDLRNRLAFWALAGLALFVAHDAIYLIQIGPGEALAATLRTAGHGYWGWASLVLTAVALVAGVSIWLRMRQLRRRASGLGAARHSSGRFGRRFVIVWLRLAAVIAVGFVIQENVEHSIIHGHAPGVGALLGPEYPLALPVIGLIGAIAASVAAIVTRTQEALVLAIEAALRRPVRALLAGPRPPVRPAAAIGSVLAHPGAGRAPPTVVVSGI